MSTHGWMAAGRMVALVGVAMLTTVLVGCSGDPGARPAGGVDASWSGGPDIGAPPLVTGPVTGSGTDPGSAGGPSVERVDCPAATVTVGDTDGLKQALAKATPGTSIHLRDGVYEGKFVASTAGSKDSPIHLCGGPNAILDGGGVRSGYALHLNGASFWRVFGFSIRNSQKGLMADGVQGVVVQGLLVEQIGDEAIHLRRFSSDNIVQHNTIRDTGKRRDSFGEGVYIGTAESNWCEITECRPDNSDRNIVRGNTISGTTAESVDIKEGTTKGLVVGNTFDGAAFSGSHADSWVDVKGNDWVIEGNIGRNSRQDGFQTHEVVDGWGTNNLFKGNTAEVNGPGYGFSFTPVRANKATCDNKVTGAAKGFGNITCG